MGKSPVGVVRELSRWTPDGLLRAGITSLPVLGLVVCVHSSAPAATGPLERTTIEANRPLAEPFSAVATPGQAAAHVSGGNPLWAIPLESLKNTRERPLFSPSRRPPPPAVIAAPAAPLPPPPPPRPPAPDRPQLTLVGTIVGKSQSVGIFLDPATKDIVRLRAGEGHGGWTLRAIQAREVTFEEGQHQATLALPARNGTDQAANSAPPTPPSVPARAAQAPTPDDARPNTPLPSVAATADGKPRAPSSSAWLDGDGQPMKPPPSRYRTADRKPPPPTWVDGDGETISPPPAALVNADGTPLGPAVWLDGYGRPIGPAPATWQDGDGQSISAPPYRWIDGDGEPIVPPPFVWRDGDGQLISPPPARSH